MVYVMAGGDRHGEFEHKKAIKEFIAEIKISKPDVVVLTGDILDFYAVSRYLKDGRVHTVQKDVDGASWFLDDVRDAAPGEVHLEEGNHERRLRKYILRNAPELFELEELSVPSLLDLDERGIVWHPETEDHFIDGILYRHGEYVRKQVGWSARIHCQEYGESVCVGHCHRLGRCHEREANRATGEEFVGIEAGCLCTDEAARDYRHRPNWCRGFVKIYDGYWIETIQV